MLLTLPPPTFKISPSTLFSSVLILASTISEINVKSLFCEPSPNNSIFCSERLAIMNLKKAISGRCFGPYTVKYLNEVTGNPKFS